MSASQLETYRVHRAVQILGRLQGLRRFFKTSQAQPAAPQQIMAGGRMLIDGNGRRCRIGRLLGASRGQQCVGQIQRGIQISRMNLDRSLKRFHRLLRLSLIQIVFARLHCLDKFLLNSNFRRRCQIRVVGRLTRKLAALEKNEGNYHNDCQ